MNEQSHTMHQAQLQLHSDGETQQTSWMSLTARAIVAFIIVINLNHLDLNVIATENCVRQHGCPCNATGWSRVLK
jgi:hypothetical protein